MAEIKVTHEPESDLLLFEFEGELSAQEILNATREHYEKTPAKRVLWDGTRGSYRAMSKEDGLRTAHGVSRNARPRQGGRTAIVAPNDADYGRLRAYEAWAEMSKTPTLYRIFRDVGEARAWLMEE